MQLSEKRQVCNVSKILSDMDNMAMNKNKGSIFKINAFTNQRILWLCVFYTYMFTSVFEASKRSPGLYM